MKKITGLLLLIGATAIHAQTVSPGAGGGGTVKTVTADCGLRGGGSSTVALSVDGDCWAAGGGTAQAQTATYTTGTTLTLVNGLQLCWLPSNANTATAPTFAPNGLTAHTIVRGGSGGALLVGDVTTTAVACAIYNATGTRWELQNPARVSSPCSGPGFGDGTNAITAGPYLQTNCINETGSTVTITGIWCLTDNAGTSTLNATNGAGTALLTGAITCSNTLPGAAGTQSATVTIANGDGVKFTFTSDGVTKGTTWTIAGTR